MIFYFIFYKAISLNFCIRSTSVLFCPLQSNSFHFGLIRPTLVLISRSILFTSVLFGQVWSNPVHFVHFGLLRFVRSTLIYYDLFGPFVSIQSTSVHYVHFSLIQSTLVHFVHFRSIWSNSIHFSPIHSTLVLFG